jgi:serine/threonine protein kinase
MGCARSAPAGAPEEEPEPELPFFEGKFAEQFDLGAELGAGAFSIVHECIHRETGRKYAVKCISKKKMGESDLEDLHREVIILKELDHDNIMKVRGFFEEKTKFYLVSDIYDGGELLHKIQEKNFYSEEEARAVMRILLEATSYLHEKNIVHRDLKPQNLLIKHKGEDDTNSKLIDVFPIPRSDFFVLS